MQCTLYVYVQKINKKAPIIQDAMIPTDDNDDDGSVSITCVVNFDLRSFDFHQLTCDVAWHVHVHGREKTVQTRILLTYTYVNYVFFFVVKRI